MNTLRRLILAASGVALATLAIALVLDSWQRARVSALLLDNRLEHAVSVLQLVETQQRDTLGSRADLLAGNQAFVSYVAQALEPGTLPGMGVDVASLGDILRDRREQLSLDMLGLVGLDGRVIAATDSALQRRSDLLSEAAVREAIDTLQPTMGVLREPDRLLLLSVRPLQLSGSVQGFLVAGRRLDDAYTRTLAAAADLDVALLATSADSTAVLASSLSTERAGAVASGLVGAGPLLQASQTGAGKTLSLPIENDVQALRIAPLFGDAGQGLAVALIAPVTPTALRQAMAGPAWLLLAWLLLLAVLCTHWIWRAVLRPLQLLPELLDGAAAGDLHRQMPIAGGALPRQIAAAFNRLMAAWRERATAVPESRSPVEPTP